MTKPLVLLVAATIALNALVCAGPTLVGLAHAAAPLVLAVGAVAIALRIVFFHTRKW